MSSYTTIMLYGEQTIKDAIRNHHLILEPTFRWACGGTDEIAMGYLANGNTLEITPEKSRPATYPPLTFHCKNGVISHYQLENAQREVNSGYTVIFTLETKGVFSDKASPYETPMEVTENPLDGLSATPDFEREYYKLRTALRIATLRHTEYKLPDTAIIAEELKQTNNLSQATDSFERMLQEIADQAFQKGCEHTTRQYDPLLEREQRNTKRLRQKINEAINTLSGEGYYSGGMVRSGESYSIFNGRENVTPAGSPIPSLEALKERLKRG